VKVSSAAARAGFVAGGLGVALVVSGCTTSPGAAAIVGNDTISAATLQHDVDAATKNTQLTSSPTFSRAEFARQQLGQLILQRVVDAAAADRHVSVTPAEVDRQIASFAQQAGGRAALYQQAAAQGITAKQLPDSIRTYVLQQKIGAQLVATVPVSQAQLQAAYQKNIDSYDQVHAAHILVKTKQLAEHLLALARKTPSQFAALAQKYSIDTGSKNSGGDLGFQPRSQLVAPFANAIFAAKPGTFLVVHSQFGWHVVHVIAHHHVSLAAATPQLKQQLLQSTETRLTDQALATVARRLGIHVNPRYGRFDFTQLTVVALSPKDGVSSPAPAHG
jgi:parvulin-like peptidyl-prolyl isomerase